MLYFVLLGPVILFSLWATIKVKRTFAAYARIGSGSGLTGAQVARIILDRHGLMEVGVEESHGFLSDHYDPGQRRLRLSGDVFHSSSLSAIGVAAHETGHALQHAEKYAPLMLRQAMVPIGAFGSNFAWILLMLGLFLGAMSLIKVGILLFTAAVVVTLITLPVEFDASRRAKAMITNLGLVTTDEAAGAGKVLDAAAMTYVAAALTAIVQLVYFLLRFGLLGGDD
ncbi:zinc metallopeptidase [bacterium]|nr:zinc metallopeptidase [bacterium]